MKVLNGHIESCPLYADPVGVRQTNSGAVITVCADPEVCAAAAAAYADPPKAWAPPRPSAFVDLAPVAEEPLTFDPKPAFAHDPTQPVGTVSNTEPVTVPVPETDFMVRLHPDSTTVEPEAPEDPEKLVVQSLGFTMALSREMAIDYGLVDQTPEEAAERAVQRVHGKRAEAARRAQPGPDLTLETVLAHFNLDADFAQHLLHPACYCTIDDDPMLCSWARELGWEWSWEEHKVVRRAS